MNQLDHAARAERSGDLPAALVHLHAAHVAPAHRREHARVHWRTAGFYVRRHRFGAAAAHLALVVLAALFG